MELKNIKLRGFWKYFVIVIVVIVLLHIALWIYSIPAFDSKLNTEKYVPLIHAMKLTISSVDGSNLPPTPDPTVNDKTVAGIDANHNGIRDDVELAIFTEYPHSEKVRAAELQYAMGLQAELTEVSNSDTLVAALQEVGRGFDCIYDTVPGVTPTSTHETDVAIGKIQNMRVAEVESLVLNTNLRKDKYQEVGDYMTSMGDIQGKPDCDIDLQSLPD